MAQEHEQKQAKRPTRRKAPTRRTSVKESGAESPDAIQTPAEEEGAAVRTAPEGEAPQPSATDADAVVPGDETVSVPDAPESETDGEAAGPTRRKAPTRRKDAGDSAPLRRKASGHKLAKRAVDDEDDPSGSGPSASRHRVWPFFLVLVVFVAFIVGSLLFCWQKWWHYDDYSDIKGAWKVEATGDIIVFDSHYLKLTSTISYEYRLNTQDKVITYTFGDLEGGGHYYFDTSRQRLLIFDGDETLDLFAEVGMFSDDLLASDTADDAMTVLSKVSDDTNATPTGRGSGLATGNASHGEREYLVAPDPEPSSSSSSKRNSHSSSDRGNSSDQHDSDEYDDSDETEFEDEEELEGEDEFTEEYDEYGNPIDEYADEGYDEYGYEDEEAEEALIEYDYTYEGEDDA